MLIYIALLDTASFSDWVTSPRDVDEKKWHEFYSNRLWRNAWKILKCDAGERWRRSVGPIMWEMKKCLLRVNEQRNILHEIRKWKANWIGHIVRRNCLLKQVIEGKIKGEMEVEIRRGRRRKELLDDLKDRRGYSHLKEGALDRTMWRHHFGGGFGPVIRQNTEWMNETMELADSSYRAVQSLVGIAVSNPASGMDVRLFWLQCVVR